MIDKNTSKDPPTDGVEIAQLFRAMVRAVDAGDVTAVKDLLRQNVALANAKDVNDKTALHIAAEHDHVEIAEILLAAGADLEQSTIWGMTPLQWAANMGSRKVAEKLLEKGAKLNMWSAAGLGMLDVVQSYWHDGTFRKEGAGQNRYVEVEKGKYRPISPPVDERTLISCAFYIACRNGHTGVADFLLQKGADINFRGFFSAPGLHWAAINGHRETVEFLVNHGADIQLKDE